MNKKEGTKAKENNLEVRYANLEGQAGVLEGKRKKKVISATLEVR